MIPLNGLGEIVEKYDLYLFDQFGTLHDGIAPYEGAIPVLKGLSAAEKNAAMVSNSGRSGRYNRERMMRLGFPADLLPPVMTSGDCLGPWLAENYATVRPKIYVTGELDEFTVNG